MPTPNTLEPVPEIAATPGATPVAVAHAPTTSLTTIQVAVRRGAHMLGDGGGVGAGDREHGRVEPLRCEPGPLDRLVRRFEQRPHGGLGTDGVPLLGPPCARWSALLSRSRTAASVFVAPPSTPSTKRASVLAGGRVSAARQLERASRASCVDPPRIEPTG